MRSSTTLNRSFRARIQDVFSAPFRKLNALLLSLGSALMLMSPTLCDPKFPDTDALFANMADIIVKIAFYVGGLITIGGIFSLVLAYKDDNPDGQTRAVRLIVVGIVLVGFRGILEIAGIL